MDTEHEGTQAPSVDVEQQAAESGQTLVEYGLILALIVLASIAALTVFGGGVGALYNNIVAQTPFG